MICELQAFQEPFIDVSIGGQSVPGGIPGVMLVWAVTAQGRVSICTINNK